jgi:hypothetical protein
VEDLAQLARSPALRDPPDRAEEQHRVSCRSHGAMFEQNTDEVTAIPRYMTGENATTGAAGTSRGMSMLMGAANIVIKDLITNWDEGVTRVHPGRLYRWNMQFNPRQLHQGRLRRQGARHRQPGGQGSAGPASWTSSPAHANPMDAPYIKRDVLPPARRGARALRRRQDRGRGEAEQQSEQAKRMAQMQQSAWQAQLALAEAQAKVAKLMAEAELTRPAGRRDHGQHRAHQGHHRQDEASRPSTPRCRPAAWPRSRPRSRRLATRS